MPIQSAIPFSLFTLLCRSLPFRSLVLLLAIGLPAGAAAASDLPVSPEGKVKAEGKLFHALFHGYPEDSDPTRLKAADIACEGDSDFRSAVSSRLTQWFAANRQFRSRIPLAGRRNTPERWLSEKRRLVERGIVTLLGPQTAEAAAAYATKATLFYEWEGMSDGPLDEALFAEQWLEKTPGTPLRAYLLLFLLHRWRSGIEALEAEKAPERVPALRKKYGERLAELMKCEDPLIRWIAEDIDTAKRVYLLPQ
ncbi:MAG: hypothetical protein KA419_12315 [Acidobacteria bacterium]|nr:hypothetical protein [Acidobacteriota bacterium]